MATNGNNEILFKKSFNISHKLEKLINGFNFSTDPKDGIKDVRIKDIKVASPCETYDFSFAINDNNKSLIDTIKAKNISTDCVIIKEIGLDLIFYDGFLDQRKKKIEVKIEYFNHDKIITNNPTINKYLQCWGLVNQEL